MSKHLFCGVSRADSLGSIQRKVENAAVIGKVYTLYAGIQINAVRVFELPSVVPGTP